MLKNELYSQWEFTVSPICFHLLLLDFAFQFCSQMCLLFILALGRDFFFVLKKKKREEANNNNITNIAPAIPRKRKIMYPCLYAVNKFRGIKVKSWRGLTNEDSLQLRSGKQ